MNQSDSCKSKRNNDAKHYDQYYLEVQEKRKFDVLTRSFDIQSPELAIIFGRTKRRVDELSEALNLRGYNAEGIHGDLSKRNVCLYYVNLKKALLMF